MERRLVAVAFADLVGFSELVERNDINAVKLWNSLRSDLLEPKIAEFKGTLLRVVGDALFVRFDSVVDSVEWARAVLGAMAAAALPAVGADRPTMRIGINVEDAIVTDNDLHGEGINIAARIHALAEPGEIVVTQAVHAYVHKKVDAEFVDLGEHDLHHVSYPVRLYKLARTGGGNPGIRSTPGSRPHVGYRPALRNGPGVMVMPFRVLSDNRAEDYFGDGITEDIVSALSQVRAFFVIARSTANSLQRSAGDLGALVAQLGVRYLVEGTVRRSAGLLRINARLLDATLGSVLWSKTYDGPIDHLFDFQDQIAASVVQALLPLIQQVEMSRVRAKPTTSLDAYDCVLKALSLLYTFDRADFFESASYIDRAIQLDPSYSQAFAHKAWWYVLCFGEGKVDNPSRDVRLAASVANRAVQLDPDDAYALSVGGHVEGFLCARHEVGVRMFDRALAVNPHSAFAWGVSASTLSFMGEHDEALRRLEVVGKLSPSDSLNFFFWTVAGLACFVADRLDEAVAHLTKARAANPRFVATHRLAAASLALLGRDAEAQEARDRLLEIDPQFDVGQFIAWYPMVRAADRERLQQGLTAAGLP
jgi:adenylate cyclase